jgi:hypothetical protein
MENRIDAISVLTPTHPMKKRAITSLAPTQYMEKRIDAVPFLWFCSS